MEEGFWCKGGGGAVGWMVRRAWGDGLMWYELWGVDYGGVGLCDVDMFEWVEEGGIGLNEGVVT